MSESAFSPACEFACAIVRVSKHCHLLRLSQFLSNQKEQSLQTSYTDTSAEDQLQAAIRIAIICNGTIRSSI